ncbi:hypothetical protein C0J52_11757 [Blattella germanica]|nr:hypothetical protein C0J52_11757 [Blattella germanica]
MKYRRLRAMTHVPSSSINIQEQGYSHQDKTFCQKPEPQLSSNGSNEFDWREFVCGWGAAFINITVTYPINKLIFRQMLHGVGVASAAGQLSSEGFYYLYRGILPPLCQKSLSLSIMFGVYEECRRPLENAEVPHYVSKVIAAMVAGTVEATLMPFERIQTLLQHQKYHSHFRNTFHAVQVIGLKYGIKEYYRGLVPILLRNGPSNVFFFVIRDEVNCYLPRYESWWVKTTQQFACGALIGAFTSTVFYPMNVVKVYVQSKIGGEYRGVISVLIELYKTRGLRDMYKGVHMNYTRAFISWGRSNQYVTCGSVLKLMNVGYKVRLHSHDVKYGTGSGQQSVTGTDVQEDVNSHWVIKSETGNHCVRGYLSATSKTYGRPINGQSEIVGVTSPGANHVHWQAMEGLFIHPSDFNPKQQMHHEPHTEL